MTNQPAVTAETALVALQQQNTPESQAIIDYIQAIKAKNIAALGTDEAFILQDNNGQIKAFKRALDLSVENGGLVKPGFGNEMPHIVSAQGYEMWAESTGASVIFPKEVLVGNQWKPNPYAERDPNNRRILAVHARAIAFRYSSMGIPQVSDWTTIFDTPSYRMIDLLAKAKKLPQCFKVLPKNRQPKEEKNETWASYPFDESMDLWINTSHNEVITWLSQILNREKKAMDFAQTFAKRNALKHLSGLQKSPGPQWRLPVLAWRPTGNNIVKWDASQYAHLQGRVAGMIEGGLDEFKNIEIKQGVERTSEDENIAVLESDVDPEDSEQSQDVSKTETTELSKDVKQAIYLSENFPSQFMKACSILKVDAKLITSFDDQTAIEVFKKTSELIDSEN